MNTASAKAYQDEPGAVEWESEGGSLKPDLPTPLPEGILAVTLINYRVGPYLYSKLDDAQAELRRQTRK